VKVFSKVNLANAHITELLNAVQIVLPKPRVEEDLGLINGLMSLNLSTNFYWFQQNSTHVFKFGVNDSGWVMVDNKDNFMMSQLFRVCNIGEEEALMTGI
jgi:hypothetical protein